MFVLLLLICILSFPSVSKQATRKVSQTRNRLKYKTRGLCERQCVFMGTAGKSTRYVLYRTQNFIQDFGFIFMHA